MKVPADVYTRSTRVYRRLEELSSPSCTTIWRYFDDETCRLEPIENPFGPKVLPIRSE
jgi:hypothetical protein